MRNILVAIVFLMLVTACGDESSTTPDAGAPAPATITTGTSCAETGNAFCARLTQCATVTASDCLASFLPVCCSGAACDAPVPASASQACALAFTGYPCASLMADMVPAACQ